MAAFVTNVAFSFTSSQRPASATVQREWNQDFKDVYQSIYTGTEGAGAQLVVTESGTFASGTATISGAVTNGDTVVVGGVTFTAAASPTGNQFASGAVVATSASSLAAAINATATAALKGAVYATSTAGVVTITASAPSALGNFVTLTKTGTNIAVSGATLTGGASAAAVVWPY